MLIDILLVNEVLIFCGIWVMWLFFWFIEINSGKLSLDFVVVCCKLLLSLIIWGMVLIFLVNKIILLMLCLLMILVKLVGKWVIGVWYFCLLVFCL